MNGNDSPRMMDMSKSAMYTTARMSDDEHDDTFRTPNSSVYVSRISEESVKPRISMYSMKLFDPLMASPAVNATPQATPQGGNGTLHALSVETNSPLVSLPTPTNGNHLNNSPRLSPMRSGSDVVPSSRLSEAIVDALKSQELSFQGQLAAKDEEIGRLYQVIHTLKAAHEELMEIATSAIDKEREEKDALRNKIKSMFNEI